jgi:hypothetical protein
MVERQRMLNKLYILHRVSTRPLHQLFQAGIGEMGDGADTGTLINTGFEEFKAE